MLTPDLIEDFRRDGAVRVRGAFTPNEVALVERGIERNLAEPSERALVASRDDDAGRFVEDFCNWQRIPEYEQFIRSSQAASIAAWKDETHVEENRRLYLQKFEQLLPMLRPPLAAVRPDGGFYIWLRTPNDDTEFARRLHAQYNVLVLPGSYLARTVRGVNPGAHHVRIALVPPLAECVEAMERIARFAATL